MSATLQHALIGADGARLDDVRGADHAAEHLATEVLEILLENDA
ncbi:MAG: hypothetical protein RLZZ353_1323, partial [Actinomycetota bacterium]